MCSHKGSLHYAAAIAVRTTASKAAVGNNFNGITSLCSDGTQLYTGGKDGRIMVTDSGIQIIGLDEEITGLCVV